MAVYKCENRTFNVKNHLSISDFFLFKNIHLEPSCCKKRQKSSNQETGLGKRGRLKVLNDTKMIINYSSGNSRLFRTNLVSFRTFRRPLFPKPVSLLELFCRFLQQDSSRSTYFVNDFLYLGEGHNLQEHSIVLVKYHPLPDVPGVKLRCVRGARDLPHVIKKKQ